MFRYCSQRSNVTLARGSPAIASSASRRTSASWPSSVSQSKSRRISVTVTASAPPSMSCGWTKPSRPSVVSGESESGGRLATKRAAALSGLTSFPFAVPGWTPTPWKVTFSSIADQVSFSISPTSAPSSV